LVVPAFGGPGLIFRGNTIDAIPRWCYGGSEENKIKKTFEKGHNQERLR